MRRISQQEWENEHMHNPRTEGEALAVSARPQDVALLPLPDSYMASEFVHNTAVYGANQMQAYARANVTAALASAQAREEELRAEVERWRERDVKWQQIANLARQADMRAERLAKALRELARWEEGDSIIRKIALDALAESTNAATQTGETT